MKCKKTRMKGKFEQREPAPQTNKQDIGMIRPGELRGLGKEVKIDPIEVQGKSRVIKLELDATMEDLFGVMHRIESKAPSHERKSGSFWVGMWGKFSRDQFRAIMRLEDRIDRTKRKFN